MPPHSNKEVVGSNFVSRWDFSVLFYPLCSMEMQQMPDNHLKIVAYLLSLRKKN